MTANGFPTWLTAYRSPTWLTANRFPTWLTGETVHEIAVRVWSRSKHHQRLLWQCHDLAPGQFVQVAIPRQHTGQWFVVSGVCASSRPKFNEIKSLYIYKLAYSYFSIFIFYYICIFNISFTNKKVCLHYIYYINNY